MKPTCLSSILAAASLTVAPATVRSHELPGLPARNLWLAWNGDTWLWLPWLVAVTLVALGVGSGR